jgi:alkane 1-monooxygenase
MFESCAIYFLVGWTSSISTAYGHELVHKKGFMDKLVGQFIFSKRFYGHYFHDHVQSHHKKVGTLEDHSTARYNETFYHFFYRSVTGQVKGIYNSELERLTKNENISGI